MKNIALLVEVIYKMLINNNVSDNIWSFSLTQLSNTLSVVGLLEPCYLAESEGRPGRTFINFFCNFFLSKSTQEGRGDKNCEVITRTHAHTQRNRFYFTKTEHFFYIDTQIQPKICVIRALPTPMLIKNEKNRENTATTVVIQNISQDLPTGWAEWLLGGWKRLEAFFLIWMRPLCCNLLNRIVRFNWRRIKF